MILHGQFLLGVAVSIVTIAVQALATLGVLRAVRAIARRLTRRRPVAALLLVMSACGFLLTAAHLVQVAIWALFYLAVGAAPPGDDYYLAFVNFTTLGYGDILPDPYWRLLGPMTAANGMLLFGWSTAVLFAVLSKSLEILRMLR